MISNGNLIRLVFLMLFMMNANANTQKNLIDEQLIKQQRLSDLAQEVKVAKSKSELAKTIKECRSFGGCLELRLNDDSPNLLVEENKNAAKQDKDQDVQHLKSLKNSQLKLVLNRVNGLSIDAIINNHVVFSNIEGNYAIGDVLFDNISVLEIGHDKVVLGLDGKKIKTLKMDWIRD